jgi:outer membrane immunogenic protein
MKTRGVMLGFTLAGALGVAALPANAADLSPGGGMKDGSAPTVAAWSGFYVGVNGGGGFAEEHLGYAPTVFAGVTPSGGFGGGQIGYNWESPLEHWRFAGYGSIVLGIEADIQGSGFSDSGFDSAGNFFKSELDYFGTVRGRVGYATDRTLYYVTGGLAYGGIKNQAIIGPADYSIDTTAVGYAVGGGFELKTGKNWSMKLEYQYINLGKNDPANPTFGAFSANGGKVVDDDFSTFRVGMNYFVAPAYEPLK